MQTNNIANEGIDLTGGAPGRDIGDDGCPSGTVAGDMRRQDTERNAAGASALKARADAEAQDSPEDVIRCGLAAAHEATNGAQFAEFIRRAQAILTRAERPEYRHIPEAPELEPELAARVDGTAASVPNMADPGNVRTADPALGMAPADPPGTPHPGTLDGRDVDPGPADFTDL